MDIIKKAKDFASHIHKDQVRNDSKKTPYIPHLLEVSELVTQSGGNDAEIVAAWLHDAVEDTDVTIEDIQKEFGNEIADIVNGLTDLPEWLSLSLYDRKTKQAERVANESASVKRVKLADQISNVQIVGKGDLDWGMDMDFAYLESAKKIAESCVGVSLYLDNLFSERYQKAFNNLKARK
ncbi:MAG: hypothetical protein JWP09_648 [Candidatus Taylorbacteria bacterium]|nr:hypothetical protein [Candidatus Taylorbacteria bacterium]